MLVYHPVKLGCRTRTLIYEKPFPFRTLRSACLCKRGWRVPHQMNKNNVAKSWMEEIYAQIVILFVFGMSGWERKLFPCSFHFFLLHFLDLISLPTCHASTHLFYHRNHQNCWDVNMLQFQSKWKICYAKVITITI